MPEHPAPDAADIFCDALDRPPAEREAYIRQACEGDDALQREVLSLLNSHDRSGGFLDESPVADAARVFADELDDPLIGAALGAYRIVQRIGAGGMGTVYLGERADAEFHKRVAVKVIRRGMDTDDILSRFRNERQVLANLEHPNIARLLDGGATDDGRPFLVMEYVEGERLDTHADRAQLSIAQRLDLFLTLCDAVQHAHQNLVVHRDLKPGNVLITADGSLKLLDFGVSKMLDESEHSVGAQRTVTCARPFTAAYASPEQLRGGQTTTATDVFALGVILFELLTGCHPFRSATQSAQELERAVCEDPVSAPSQVLWRMTSDASADPDLVSAICRARHTEPARLRRQLRGDLENIILKALRKEPERRYTSVEQLSEDIRRYRLGLPVGARPDTLRYRASKFISRNRAAVSAAAMIVLALISALIVSLVMYSHAEASRRSENTARLQAEETSRFLRSLLASINPTVARARDTTLLRDVLDDAAARIDADLADQPRVAQSIHLTIGQTYDAIAVYDEAMDHLERAVELARVHFGPQSNELARSLQSLASARANAGDVEQAIPLLEEALAIDRANDPGGADEANDLRIYGEVMQYLGQYDAATEHLTESVRLHRHQPVSPNLPLARALRSLSAVLTDRERLDESLVVMNEALEIIETAYPADHPSVGGAHYHLGWVLRRMGRAEEAEQHYRTSLDIQEAALGPTHPRVATVLSQLGGALEDQQRLADAEPFHQRALAVYQDNYGRSHRDVGTAYNNLGLLYLKMQRYAESETHFREAIDIYTETIGPDHVFVALVLTNLISLLEEQDRLVEAAPEIERCGTLVDIHWSPEHAQSLFQRNTEAALALARGEDAVKALIRTCDALLDADALSRRLPRIAARRVVRYAESIADDELAAAYRPHTAPEQ